MQQILTQITASGELHARWLNTLSFMENAGARKISACEHPLTVDLMQLKHAAEEHRHAYYLKKQLQKLDVPHYSHYQDEALLAPVLTRQYLHRLDVQACRYLKEQLRLSGSALRYAAYLFVTYAIEMRADALYPVYQEVLKAGQSRVTVRSIIAEEEGHLEEMIAQLERFDPGWQGYADRIRGMEQELFTVWLDALTSDVTAYAHRTAAMA